MSRLHLVLRRLEVPPLPPTVMVPSVISALIDLGVQPVPLYNEVILNLVSCTKELPPLSVAYAIKVLARLTQSRTLLQPAMKALFQKLEECKDELPLSDVVDIISAGAKSHQNELWGGPILQQILQRLKMEYDALTSDDAVKVIAALGRLHQENAPISEMTELMCAVMGKVDVTSVERHNVILCAFNIVRCNVHKQNNGSLLNALLNALETSETHDQKEIFETFNLSDVNMLLNVLLKSTHPTEVCPRQGLLRSCLHRFTALNGKTSVEMKYVAFCCFVSGKMLAEITNEDKDMLRPLITTALDRIGLVDVKSAVAFLIVASRIEDKYAATIFLKRCTKDTSLMTTEQAHSILNALVMCGIQDPENVQPLMRRIHDLLKHAKGSELSAWLFYLCRLRCEKSLLTELLATLSGKIKEMSFDSLCLLAHNVHWVRPLHSLGHTKEFTQCVTVILQVIEEKMVSEVNGRQLASIVRLAGCVRVPNTISLMRTLVPRVPYVLRDVQPRVIVEILAALIDVHQATDSVVVAIVERLKTVKKDLTPALIALTVDSLRKHSSFPKHESFAIRLINLLPSAALSSPWSGSDHSWVINLRSIGVLLALIAKNDVRSKIDSSVITVLVKELDMAVQRGHGLNQLHSVASVLSTAGKLELGDTLRPETITELYHAAAKGLQQNDAYLIDLVMVAVAARKLSHGAVPGELVTAVTQCSIRQQHRMLLREVSSIVESVSRYNIQPTGEEFYTTMYSIAKERMKMGECPTHALLKLLSSMGQSKTVDKELLKDILAHLDGHFTEDYTDWGNMTLALSALALLGLQDNKTLINPIVAALQKNYSVLSETTILSVNASLQKLGCETIVGGGEEKLRRQWATARRNASRDGAGCKD